MENKELLEEEGWYEKNKEELQKLYPGKFILISGNQIITTNDTYAGAANEGVRLELNNFLIKECLRDEPIDIVIAADF